VWRPQLRGLTPREREWRNERDQPGNHRVTLGTTVTRLLTLATTPTRSRWRGLASPSIVYRITSIGEFVSVRLGIQSFTTSAA
jgi:hypothetical protein